MCNRERTSLVTSLRDLTGSRCSCVEHFAFLLIFSSFTSFYDLISPASTLTWRTASGDTHHICVRLHGVFNHARVVGRWASVPDAVHPDQGAAAVVARESAVFKGGHKGQTNRHRRLKIHRLHQPSVRSHGNSALFSQNRSGTYNKYNLSSVKVWNCGIHIFLWLNRCFAFRLAWRSN